MARQYDRAIQQLRNTLEMDPSYELPHLVLGLSYAQKGDFALAVPELRKAVELSHGTPLMISALANVLGAIGKQGGGGEASCRSNRCFKAAVRLSLLFRGCLRGFGGN